MAYKQKGPGDYYKLLVVNAFRCKVVWASDDLFR